MLGQGQAWSLSPDHVIRNHQTDHVCQVTKVGVWVGGRLPSAEAWGGGTRAQRVERVDVLSSAPAARTSPASSSPPPPVWTFLRLSASDAHRRLRVPAGLRSSVLVAVSSQWSRVTVARGDVVTCSRRNGEWNVSLCSAVTSARTRRKRAGMTCVRESELFGRGAMSRSDFCEFPCETQMWSRSVDYSPVCGHWSVTDCECSGTGSCKLARLNCVSLIVGSECGSVWIRVIWGVLGWSWGDTFTCFYLRTLRVEWAEGVKQFLKDPRVQAESDSSFTLVKLGLGCFSFCALCCYRRYCVTFMALQGIGTTRSKVQGCSVSVSCCGLGVTGFLLGSAVRAEPLRPADSLPIPVFSLFSSWWLDCAISSEESSSHQLLFLL